MRARARGLIGSLVVAVVASLTLGGCVLTPHRPGASQAPSAAEEPPSLDARPILDVPDVRPQGFVAPPPGEGLARYEEQPLAWQTCETKFDCATVRVPLDYARPDDQAVVLALKRRPATQDPRLGSLFINPGGPGGSGVDYVRGFESAGLEQYDVVGWDPRGVGDSTPVQCESGRALEDYLTRDESPDDEQDRLALLDNRRDFGRSCLELSGALLQHISTPETARDLDLLRTLVGDDKLSYFGSSYGTQIGATYAQLFPSRVGRMVLDGAVNITDQRPVDQLDGFERAIGNFATATAAKRGPLGSTKDEVLTSITDLWRRLETQPIPAGQRELNVQLALSGVVAALYTKQYWPVLQQSLEAAVTKQNGVGLIFLADNLNERSRDGTYGQINYAFPAIRCLDSQDVSARAIEQRTAAVLRRTPVMGTVSGPDYVCPMWPVAPAPELERITAAGAAPIVVIGTTGDPATPYEFAQSMAKQLESGVLMTLRGDGHLAYGQSSCIKTKVDAYLTRGTVPADGTIC